MNDTYVFIAHGGPNFNENRHTFGGLVESKRNLVLEQRHLHCFRIDLVYHDAVRQIRLSYNKIPKLITQSNWSYSL